MSRYPCLVTGASYLLICFTVAFLVIPCHGWQVVSFSSTSSPTGPVVVPTPSSSTSSLRPPMASPSGTWIQNFRSAAGIGNIYRCASPDVLGEQLIAHGGDAPQYFSDPDRFVLVQAHLVVDLRSPSERKEVHSKMWMNHAGMRVFEVDEEYQVTGRRCVVRIDVLSPPRFMKYIEDHWLSNGEKAQAKWYKLVDGGKLHELLIERLNEYGLAGLNEAILETGKEELCRSLKTITAHLEQNPGQSAVIHCVQGKDRTGMLVMLLQSLLGVSDRTIIADYFMSNQMLQQDSAGGGGSAAANTIRTRGKMDRRFFSGTNEQAMISTLHFLRGKYGSVSPGYLDAIGFDASWRNRLSAVLVSQQGSPSTSRL